jgi:hypothetical protein
MTLTNSKPADVFAIPELLELILLSLPTTTCQLELSSIRTIIGGQTVCNTWHSLVKDSARIRSFCYLPTHVLSSPESDLAMGEKSTTPEMIRHNPYISSLLLRGRRWGGIWPFSGNFDTSMYGPTTPQRWSYFFEVSKSEFMRFPAAGAWRDMLITDPPFREIWCTHTSQMTGIDSLLYNSSRCTQESAGDDNEEETWTAGLEAVFRFAGYRYQKRRQKTRRYCEGGFTLGAMVDVVEDMFGRDARAEWVVLESVRGDDDNVPRVPLLLGS